MNNINSVSVFSGEAQVGSFKASGDGVYDLAGNVWEWCEDYYDGDSGARVLRGASWFNYAPDRLLSSFRNYYSPDYRYNFVGFRCVLVVGSSP